MEKNNFADLWMICCKATMNFWFAPYLFWLNGFNNFSSPGNIAKIQRIWKEGNTIEQNLAASMEVYNMAARGGQEIQSIIDAIMYQYLIKVEETCSKTNAVAYV